MAEPAGELKQETSQKPIWPVVIGTVSMVIGAGMLLQFVVIFSGWCVLWAGYEIDIGTLERAFTCTEGILTALLIGVGDRLVRRWKHHLHEAWAGVWIGFVVLCNSIKQQYVADSERIRL